jgi:hypothetical protein
MLSLAGARAYVLWIYGFGPQRHSPEQIPTAKNVDQEIGSGSCATTKPPDICLIVELRIQIAVTGLVLCSVLDEETWFETFRRRNSKSALASLVPAPNLT